MIIYEPIFRRRLCKKFVFYPISITENSKWMVEKDKKHDLIPEKYNMHKRADQKENNVKQVPEKDN